MFRCRELALKKKMMKKEIDGNIIIKLSQKIQETHKVIQLVVSIFQKEFDKIGFRLQKILTNQKPIRAIRKQIIMS